MDELKEAVKVFTVVVRLVSVDKLLETNEIYRTIYETQMKGKEEE